MAQHGYLREYDEGWDRSENRDRERSWRDDRDRNDDRNRDFMFGDRDRGGGDRSVFDRMGERARERFSDDDRQWRGAHRDDWSNRDQSFGSNRSQQGFGGYQSEFDRSPQDRSSGGFRSHQDDHYRSWRDQQMQSLDRDYQDYCREREEQFHRDFNSWRGQRHGSNPGPLRTGMTQTGQSHDPSGMLELKNEVTENAEPQPDPTDAATLGTNSSSTKGR
ncbi:MAG TPA: hypothetical protein VF098_03595 [Sphingomicrobium sp.]|jgi:hypothetical protein